MTEIKVTFFLFRLSPKSRDAINMGNVIYKNQSNVKCLPSLSVCGIWSCMHVLCLLHQWCNGKRVRGESGRSCVRSQVRSNQKKKGVCCFSIKHETLRGRTNGIRVVFAASVIDHEFHPRSSQTEDNKIGVCCFSAKHAALRDKNKYSWSRNQDNVYVCCDMFICGQLFQCTSTIKKNN